ncbi:hypothetical protein OF83DRAFT_1087938 [Amylostereum chailletii]|nr:hypothetical protein OF83DRAFT_1087938 [Amylostereum chailletii]
MGMSVGVEGSRMPYRGQHMGSSSVGTGMSQAEGRARIKSEVGGTSRMRTWGEDKGAGPSKAETRVRGGRRGRDIEGGDTGKDMDVSRMRGVGVEGDAVGTWRPWTWVRQGQGTRACHGRGCGRVKGGDAGELRLKRARWGRRGRDVKGEDTGALRAGDAGEDTGASRMRRGTHLGVRLGRVEGTGEGLLRGRAGASRGGERGRVEGMSVEGARAGEQGSGIRAKAWAHGAQGTQRVQRQALEASGARGRTKERLGEDKRREEMGDTPHEKMPGLTRDMAVVRQGRPGFQNCSYDTFSGHQSD